MISYGRYRYATGREGGAGLISLASRNRSISIYAGGADERGYIAERFAPRLPGADVGRSCVRFKRRSDVDDSVLGELIRASAARFAEDPEFAVVR